MAASSTKASRKGRKPAAAHDAAEWALPTPIELNEITLKRAVFEIAIVAIGVLLALLTEQARQSWSNRALAEEARTEIAQEMDENRARLVGKLFAIHSAYKALEANPAAGPTLVQQHPNFQITMNDAAWTMAVQTGAVRFLTPRERQAFGYIYSSQGIYNRIVAEEMNRWTALATAGPRDPSIKLWEAYAERVAISICIASIRLERFRNPALATRRLQPICMRYRLSTPPQQLYKDLGLPAPNSVWKPGQEF